MTPVYARSLSIRGKLTLLMIAVGIAALLVAVVAIMINHYFTLRHSKASQLVALADVVASNSTAAMLFDQPLAAEELLASLKRQPTVRYACLFDQDEKLFAGLQYDVDEGFEPEFPEWLGYDFTRDGHLDVSQLIIEDDEVLGRIYVRATMTDLWARFQRDVAIATGAVTLALLVAAVASTRLQRVIADPIVALADATRRITTEGNHTIRVERRSDDEIGNLYRQFNLMLDRLQEGEDRLRAERDYSTEILNGTPVVVWGVRREGTTSFFNPAAERITGYRAEEVVGRVYWDINRPGEDNPRGRQVRADLQKGDLRNYEAILITRSGEERVLVWNTLTRRDEQGEPIETIGFGNDITERKRADDEREDLIVELEAKNAELERFAYTVSHDLKSPLVTIKGHLELLSQDLDDGEMEAVEEDIRQIAMASDKMSQLLGQVLQLSRIGRVTHPSEDVGLEELARDAVSLLDGMIGERSVDVRVAADLPVLHGDRVRLAEVMQNLIENAVKYMGKQPNPKVEIGVRRSGDETICYVRDNGLGIESPYHEKVFGLFDQLDPEVDGTGVGLALVKRIIEVHGGRIWIESEGKGQGSTFCFTLGESYQAGAMESAPGDPSPSKSPIVPPIDNPPLDTPPPTPTA